MVRKLTIGQLSRIYDRCPALTVLCARQYLAEDPKNVPALLWLSMALVDMARYEEAEQTILKAIKYCRKKRQIALAQMGHLFREAGDYGQAFVWYRKAIKADPADATYHIFLGAALAHHGRLREAEKVHRTAIKCVDGRIDEAYFNLGLVLRAQERFEEAAESFRQAIRIDPKYRSAKRALRDVERCVKLADT